MKYLFNLSISSGVVIASIWKTAHVVPLNKGGDKADLINFKLFRLAKVLESFINNQVKSFISIYPVLSPQQSGFRAIIVLLLPSPPLLMILYLWLIKANTVLSSLWI